ncbi:hypothetical protein KYG33_08370 [Chryseobacterium sp. D764]|nr:MULTISPECIES: hypothetical protein [unclassified Chryseobacterium]QXU51040.1 hypothetical protein KYG33_08370 [Chryseobacterium sp. D764]CAD0220256.1 conserved protein of unknown function [Chryseobacterium sp. JV274]
MPHSGLHMKTYKAVITMLVLVFSLSPCSVKRNVLDIFDIQYISGLNKVKITSSLSSSCDAASASAGVSVSKANIQGQYKDSFSNFYSSAEVSAEEKIFFNEYSGHSTGNSPPKYILFKRLKLNLV